MGDTPLAPSTLFTADNPPPRPLTAPPLIHFVTRDVQPPSLVYVTIDDLLAVHVWNSLAALTLSMRYRVLKADGEIVYGSEQLAPTSNRVQNTFPFSLPEGFLLSLVLSSNLTTLRRGQCYAQMEIAKEPMSSPAPSQLLVEDYVSQGQKLSFPGGRQASPIEGPGFVSSRAFASPGAGAPVQVNVPAGARWRVISIVAGLTTDATPGNRVPEILLTDSLGNINFFEFSTLAIPPSSTGTIAFAAGLPLQSPTATTAVMPLPAMPLLLGGFAIIIQGQSGVGDQWDLFPLLNEEWIEPVT
jgi:hypothetical protein